MGCDLIKVRRSVSWSPPPFGILKFNVDGMASGKPGLWVSMECFVTAGVTFYLCFLSACVSDSNVAEVLVILKALGVS